MARDRRTVEERLVNFGQSVTIGSLQSNLFSVPEIESIIGERYELFQFWNGMYHFSFYRSDERCATKLLTLRSRLTIFVMEIVWQV